MKKFVALTMALVLMMSMSGCSLFSSGAAEDVNAKGAIQISEIFAHEDPADMEFAARYAYTTGKNQPDLVQGFKNDYDIDVIEQFMIIYGDKDDKALCEYDYYVFTTEEDAEKALDLLGREFYEHVPEDGCVLVSYINQEDTQMMIDMNVQYAGLQENTCSAYALFMKDIYLFIEIQ